MDLIYTNANRIDQGVLPPYSFDLSFGATENDFEVTIGAGEIKLDYGAYLYIEDTEYGGIVDGIKAKTNGESVTYIGRTWHGILNSKVIEPDTGEDYLVVSGNANTILSALMARLGLSALFVVPDAETDVYIERYKFHRYCNGYDGIRDMLEDNGGKLKIEWKDRNVELYAAPLVDYTSEPVDGDMSSINVEHHESKVNHLVCLGKGDLAEREVVHLYVDQFGRIGKTQCYTGLEEITATYENTNADDLESEGIKRFNELRNIDTAKFSIPETDGQTYDVGDIVGATEYMTGVTVTQPVTQKIVKIINGAVSTNYKTGG